MAGKLRIALAACLLFGGLLWALQYRNNHTVQAVAPGSVGTADSPFAAAPSDAESARATTVAPVDSPFVQQRPPEEHHGQVIDLRSSLMPIPIRPADNRTPGQEAPTSFDTPATAPASQASPGGQIQSNQTTSGYNEDPFRSRSTFPSIQPAGNSVPTAQLINSNSPPNNAASQTPVSFAPPTPMPPIAVPQAQYNALSPPQSHSTGGQVIAPRLSAPLVSYQIDENGETLTHHVVDGDTLSKLAQRYLGSADRYMQLYDANRDILGSPDLLPIGSVLKIPQREATTGTSPDHRANPSAAYPAVRQAPASKPAEGDRTAFGDGPALFGPQATPVNYAERGSRNLDRRPTAAIPSAMSDTFNSGRFDSGRSATSATYRVQIGESLEDVARRVYGDPARQSELLEANRDQLTRIEDLQPGMILRLP